MPSSTSVFPDLFKRLYRHFGPQRWWPAGSAWEMMVGAILTQNTAWTNVEKALTSLKEARVLTIPAMARMPLPRLEKLIRSSGFFRQKAKRLQSFARWLDQNKPLWKQLTGFEKTDLSRLRAQLLDQKGIGPETADAILLYAGGHATFVVDSYTRRIGQRIGLFKTDDYYEVKRFFESVIPPRASVYNEFHALIVMLAKHFCTKRNPKCLQCPAAEVCRYTRKEKL